MSAGGEFLEGGRVRETRCLRTDTSMSALCIYVDMIYMCVYIRINLCIYMYICIHVYMYIYIHRCIYIFLYICVCICQRICICIYIYTYVCTYVYTRIRVYTHVYCSDRCRFRQNPTNFLGIKPATCVDNSKEAPLKMQFKVAKKIQANLIGRVQKRIVLGKTDTIEHN